MLSQSIVIFREGFSIKSPSLQDILNFSAYNNHPQTKNEKQVSSTIINKNKIQLNERILTKITPRRLCHFDWITQSKTLNLVLRVNDH